MKLTFEIEYRTAWGEELGVIFEGQENSPIMLSTNDGITWRKSLETEEAPAGVPKTYRYGVFRDGQCTRRESGTMAHIFCPGKKRNCHYILNDSWKDLPRNSYLYSSAFCGNEATIKSPKTSLPGDNNIIFRALCPCMQHRKQRLGICGKSEILGKWDMNCPIVMEEIQPNEWVVTLDAQKIEFPTEYKFVAVDSITGKAVEWETGKALEFPVNLYIQGIDTLGILHQISDIVSEQLNVYIRKIFIETMDGLFEGHIQLYVHDVEDVNIVIANLQKMEEMKKVVRVEQFEDKP